MMLCKIKISECLLQDEGVKYVANALILNDTLTNISMKGNEIEDRGAAYLRNALAINNSLLTVSSIYSAKP